MAHEISRLTAAQVKRLGVGKHHDGGGLYLIKEESRTTPGHINASWYQRFVSPTTRKERWMGLDSSETFGLADARALSRVCRQQIANGQDPIEVRDAQKASEQEAAATKSRTFELCAREYMAAHESGWRNAKHRYQWTATLNTFAYPVVGKTRVDAVTTDDVMKILMQPAVPVGSDTSDRLRADLRRAGRSFASIGAPAMISIGLTATAVLLSSCPESSDGSGRRLRVKRQDRSSPPSPR